MRFAAGVAAGIALLVLVTLGGCYVGTRYATDDPKELAWWLVHKADKRDYKADQHHQEVMDAITKNHQDEMAAIAANDPCKKCSGAAPVHRTVVRRTKPILAQVKPDCPPPAPVPNVDNERIDRLEGRVDNLEHRVGAVEAGQKDLMTKSDEILAAIKASKATPKQKEEKPEKKHHRFLWFGGDKKPCGNGCRN